MEYSKARPAFKVWLETDDGYVFGPGVYSLLKKVIEKHTLKEAALSLDMSYRYAWGLIKRAEDRIGAPLIKTHKGGRRGGGGVNITALGKQYILEYDILYSKFRDIYSVNTSDYGIVKEIIIPKKELVIILESNLDKYGVGDRLVIKRS